MNLADVADWGLQTGLVVSLLIGLVLIIRRPFARYFGAGAAYALWLLPALRLFMPTLTVPFLRRPAAESLPPNNAAPQPSYTLPTNSFQEYFPNPNSSVDLAAQISAPSYWAAIAIIWLSVAIFWFGFQLVRQAVFMSHMRHTSMPVSDQLSKAIERASEISGMKKRPNIRLSGGVSGPMVTGLFRPLILLPQDFESRFNHDQQIFALVHEMSHVKRGDLWVALIVLGFRALFWPNPLVHYAAHKMRVDQEAACDAAVVARTGGGEAAHSYAQTLIHAAKTSTQSDQQSPLGLALYEPNSGKKFSKGDENDEMV